MVISSMSLQTYQTQLTSSLIRLLLPVIQKLNVLYFLFKTIQMVHYMASGGLKLKYIHFYIKIQYILENIQKNVDYGYRGFLKLKNCKKECIVQQKHTSFACRRSTKVVCICCIVRVYLKGGGFFFLKKMRSEKIAVRNLRKALNKPMV